MSTQTTNYKCPACTGPLHYGTSSGKLECEDCDSSFEIEAVKSYYAEKEKQAAEALADAEKHPGGDKAEWDTSDFQNGWGNDNSNMRKFSCPSCGAEMICDETTAATSCPYCGNPSVIPGQFTGNLKPDYVIPFRLEKKAAISALKSHYKGKLFLPKTFLDTNTVEKMQGVYVPFWLYDGEAYGDMVFLAKRIHTHRRGDDEITETDHFLVERSGSMSFSRVPVDASSKMPDAYMDSIEPFDYSDLKDFTTAYLPGFLADKFDVGVEESNKRADDRFRNTLKQALRNTVMGYDIVEQRSSNIHLRRGKVHYALLPVWMLTVKWNEKNYLFAINGQTGKTAGILPVSYKKVAAMFAALTVPLSILAYLIACAIG